MGAYPSKEFDWGYYWDLFMRGAAINPEDKEKKEEESTEPVPRSQSCPNSPRVRYRSRSQSLGEWPSRGISKFFTILTQPNSGNRPTKPPQPYSLMICNYGTRS